MTYILYRVPHSLDKNARQHGLVAVEYGKSMVYQEFHNNTRMQTNRGHTPNELLSLYPPE